jgi:hypothetical protein
MNKGDNPFDKLNQGGLPELSAVVKKNLDTAAVVASFPAVQPDHRRK